MLQWLVVVLWAGVIFFLSSLPSLQSPFMPFYDFLLRKAAHMTVYAVLTVLLYRALRQHTENRRHAWLFAALLAALYALSDEWHQTFVAGRHGSFRDVMIDVLGISTGYAMAQLSGVKLLGQKA